jgi:hypothetical protein
MLSLTRTHLHHYMLVTWNNEISSRHLLKYQETLTRGISLYKTLNHDYIHIHIDDEVIKDKVLVTTRTLVPSEEVVHINKIQDVPGGMCQTSGECFLC